MKDSEKEGGKLLKNNRFLRPLMVFSIPVLILVLLAAPHVWTTVTGDEIQLKTVPVDPTDLFRGSYVDLQYEIESVDSRLLDDSTRSLLKKQNRGDYKNVYVRLQQNKTGLYEAALVTLERPHKGTYLKGRLHIPYDTTSSSLKIKYGLDNFYAPSDKAKEMEAAAAGHSPVAMVKVKNGNAVLMTISFK